MKTTLYLLMLLLFFSCKHKEAEEEETEVNKSEIRTPVTITNAVEGTMADSVLLNATSTFVQDNIIKSNINGYIKAVHIKMGQYAAAGKPLFTIKTKEAESLGNTINALDPSFHFSGMVSIRSPQSGYITSITHQAGDYVQDGEQLAVLSDSKSFGFLLNLPVELRSFISTGKPVVVMLPDGTFLDGRIATIMPSVDSSSQTQAALVKVNSKNAIPENLIAKVKIIKGEKRNIISLPREAVLSDESQQNFWIMKMIDSITAVKVPVIKGMEASGRVEIIRPLLTTTDKILLSGNYGLPDTAKVKVVKTAE